VLDGSFDLPGLKPVHDGRVSDAVHICVLSRCHKLSLSAHKSVNCSPYKPTVNPRPPSSKITVEATIILSTLFLVEAIIILQSDITKGHAMQFNEAKLTAAIETARTKAAGNAKWTRAIDRAVAGLRSSELIVTVLADNHALVTSANGSYWVNGGSCQCKAAQIGHRECRHVAAMRLVELMEDPKSFKSPSGSIDHNDKAARPVTITRSVERNYHGGPIVTVRCEGWLV
jgi:hypothetical protein